MESSETVAEYSAVAAFRSVFVITVVVALGYGVYRFVIDEVDNIADAIAG